MKSSIIMHVNYCEQGQNLEEMCRKAVKWGFDGIEFRRRRSKVEETPEQYLVKLAAAVKKTGLKHVLFGAPGVDLMTEDAAKREKEIAEAMDFYRLASMFFKLTVCNTMTGSLVKKSIPFTYRDYAKHGSAAATVEQWQWAVDGFKKLGKFAVDLGFKLAFETHMGFLHDYPLVAKELADRINSSAVGVNLDYGNAVYMPNNPSLAETIRKMAKGIFYVHLKNSTPFPEGGRMAAGLADGEINHREYLRLLKEIDYSGPICIEAPRSGDREWFARQDITYLKKMLQELNWV